jgi:hypothetical protein
MDLFSMLASLMQRMNLSYGGVSGSPAAPRIGVGTGAGTNPVNNPPNPILATPPATAGSAPTGGGAYDQYTAAQASGATGAYNAQAPTSWQQFLQQMGGGSNSGIGAWLQPFLNAFQNQTPTGGTPTGVRPGQSVSTQPVMRSSQPAAGSSGFTFLGGP